MKLYCLSGHTNKPCFVLKFKGTTVMLDCGLDVTTLMQFLPLPLVKSTRLSKLPSWSPRDGSNTAKTGCELRESGGKIFIDGTLEFAIPEIGMLDMSEVDVILLSNYHSMLALPFITEYSAFKGVVYATEPTLQIGRMFMEELVEYLERVPRPHRASKWKVKDIQKLLPPPLGVAINPIAWKQCYNLHDINSCLSKVHMVGFNERMDIFGAVQAEAISSGFCIGSSNWVIKSKYEKITYLSGSSTLTTHPKPVEQAPLKDSDVLILSGLTQTPTANPDAMIGEFCVNAAVTLRNGGNVLVPCYPSGVIYDLFECLSGHLDTCNLVQVPMYFISPQANSSLAFSNILSEWLSAGKQSQVYLPEPPFPHAELIQSGRLRHYPSIHGDFSNDFKTPCIVFTGHPSLRMGDVVHFLEMWGKSSANTIIITEPDYPYLDALAPYQPLAMKVAYCPIDTSLSYVQASKLLKELKPRKVIVAERFTVPPVMLPHRTDLVVQYDPTPMSFRQGEVLDVGLKRKFEKIEIEPQLAASLMPTEVKPGVMVAKVTATLNVKDNKHVLKPISTMSGSRKRKQEVADLAQKNYIWGNLDVREFVEELKQQGVTDVKLENTAGGYIVHLESEDTLIQIEEGSTHIICEGQENLRVRIRDSLIKCLSKF